MGGLAMPADPPGDQAPDTALQRIAEAAKKLKTAAGDPSYRTISKSVANNEDVKRTSSASHTCVGWIMKATRLTSWPVLDTVVRELVHMSKEPAPEDGSPDTEKDWRRRLADEQSLRFHILWLEARQEKETGVSENLRARERFSLALHKLVIEPFNGVPRISEALRALDTVKDPHAAFLADHLPEIVSGSRTPQIQDLDTLISLCSQSGKSISQAAREGLQDSYADLLRWTSPAMYELLQHHQAKTRDQAEQVERLEDEARARARDGKPADLEVFHRSSVLRSKADTERLVARVKTLETRLSKVEAEKQELLERLKRYESAGADTSTCVVRVDSVDVLHGPMIPVTTPTGQPAQPPDLELRVTIPSWADIAPRQQPVAQFDTTGWDESTSGTATSESTTWTIPTAPSYSPASQSGTESAYGSDFGYYYEAPGVWSYGVSSSYPYESWSYDYSEFNSETRDSFLGGLTETQPPPAVDSFTVPDQKSQVARSESAAFNPSTNTTTDSFQAPPDDTSGEIPPPDAGPLVLPPGEEARAKKSFFKKFFKRGRGKHARYEP